MRHVVIGAGAGLVLGYAAVRAAGALRELRRPPPTLAPDAAAYGKLRRGFMLTGVARSVAALGTGAYGLGRCVGPEPGQRERRERRMALITTALIAWALIDLPADFVEDFALERRYGLSKQTPLQWAGDRAKAFSVSLAVGLPLIEAFATTVERAPRRWPLLATGACVPLLVLAGAVGPTFIAPLFNRFEALEGPIEPDIRALAQRYGAGDAAILRMDMSRQTEKANAYVSGLFGTKRIVVGDTLLDHFEPAQTLFVVAHELGHYVAGDVWRSVAASSAAVALVFFGAQALVGRSGAPLSSAAGLARLAFAMALIGCAIEPFVAAFSRRVERAADAFAVEATGNPAAGAAAFRRLRDRNMAEDEQPAWMELLFASHPSLRSRIAYLEAAARARTSLSGGPRT